jgi:leader peptidase (prepilin peptidase)/N-methyltransferase
VESYFWPILGALLGLVAGSFLSALVVRWPRGESLAGRSRCDGCGRQLKWTELVPLLSALRSRGRCKSCGARIDWRHPALELAAAVVGLLAMLASPGWVGLSGAILGWALLALLALDAEHQWLPDRITLPLLALGLWLGAGDMTDRLAGAAIGGGALLALALGYKWLRGRDGMGLGDVKLMAALGAWLGPLLLGPLLLVAALIGLMMAAGLKLRGKPLPAGGRIPFGACLAAAAFPIWLLASATAWAGSTGA